MEGKGKIGCGNVEGSKSGVKEGEHAEEGVAILQSEDMWKCVKGSEEVRREERISTRGKEKENAIYGSCAN